MSENQQTTTLASMQQKKEVTEVTPGFTSMAAFDALQRISKVFALSPFVPDNFKGEAGFSSCTIAVNIALRSNADPLMVMQNLVIVYGKPSWSAKYLIATANECGRFSAIRFEYFGEQGKDNYGCRAWAIEKATGEKLIGPDISMQLAKDEGWYEKKSSKWKTMPQKMLMYRAGAWWVDVYAPEIAMGFRTTEEELDIIDIDKNGNITNVTSASEHSTDNLRRPRKKVAADVENSDNQEVEKTRIIDGVDQSTGEVMDDEDIEINPAAEAAANGGGWV